MTNILAWIDVRKRFCITVNTAKENIIHVHTGERRIIKFVEVKSGLYLLQNQSDDTNKKLAITHS